MPGYLEINYINPDFEQREKFIQPQTQRSRAPYRSPISSVSLNLSYNSVVEDIDYLYARLEAIDLDFKDRFQKLYNDGGIEFEAGIVLEAIYQYSLNLKYLRQEIENLR
jgi:hypothetical protein